METRKTMLMRKHSELFSAFLAGGALLWMAGCSVGPNYKRPAVAVPDSFRGVAPAEATCLRQTRTTPAATRRRRWVTRNGGKFSRTRTFRS